MASCIDFIDVADSTSKLVVMSFGLHLLLLTAGNEIQIDRAPRGHCLGIVRIPGKARPPPDPNDPDSRHPKSAMPRLGLKTLPLRQQNLTPKEAEAELRILIHLVGDQRVLYILPKDVTQRKK